jgi:hypothetical protein
MSLSLSNELWQELLSAALPVKLANGDVELARDARRALKQLQVRQRVAGLIEDRQPPQALVRIKDRAKGMWKARKEGVKRRLSDLVQVEGTWTVELDGLGTELTYGKQRVGADAFIRASADGRIRLLNENVDLPFHVERRIGASLALGEIRYSRDQQAVVGSLQDLAVHLGDHVVLQLLARLVEAGLDTQLPNVSPITLLGRSQVSEMVSPMGGMFKVDMGVDELELEIDEDTLTLKVRFGFTQPQLSERMPEA